MPMGNLGTGTPGNHFLNDLPVVTNQSAYDSPTDRGGHDRGGWYATDTRSRER